MEPTPYDLRALGLGNEAICIAVLDGPVELLHPCFAGAKLSTVQSLAATLPSANGRATAHGTHVASVIFGQPGTVVEGYAPHCRGILIPIFEDLSAEAVETCAQLDIARAILLAVENGACIINISGGQLSYSGDPEPLLAQAIDTCLQKNVLIIAAAGNDGCACIHIPAATPSVLAVGAMDKYGIPLPSSNWGSAYQLKGILAPGQDVVGAAPSGGIIRKTGTSFATPYVTSLVALLAGLQLEKNIRPDLHLIRQLILDGIEPCTGDEGTSCEKLLGGRLDLPKIIKKLQRGAVSMTTGFSPLQVAPRDVNLDVLTSPLAPPVEAAEHVKSSELLQSSMSECNCGGAGQSNCTCGKCLATGAQLVYALGKIGYDFGSEARRDSFSQAMPDGQKNPNLLSDLLTHFDKQPFEAASVIWTLNLDATPIYAIQPAGAFAEAVYEKLCEFLRGQQDDGVELVSIPGTLAGSIRLQSGQVVPKIIPNIRGMFSWATGPLVEAVLGMRPLEISEADLYEKQSAGLSDFLNRVYYDLRNLGITAEDRALNSSATNAFQIAEVVRASTRENLDLDTIRVKKSPICRPDSECYDVELVFFNPENLMIANRIFRFTVDVSDVIPVTIGVMRSWTKR